MLCAVDLQGRCIEVNTAWQRNLGYRPEEMRGKDLLAFTHPEDHPHALGEAARVFSGAPSANLETRVQAKDGIWHWLRTSAVLEPEEGLVYARSTDITEQKTLEAEREALIAEVQSMARSDALTGLPNRRALDDQLPREMSRAL
jgi:PAS domain S-box-containing protein